MDLSAVFDRVNYSILLNKLEHYGLRGKCLSIIKSFLKDRMQYVSIDTFNSKLLTSLQCSVIQGSKLSALLYILYVNEVPKLHKLMGDSIFNNITGDNNLTNPSIIEHVTVQ